jgi:hypothetical protein
MSGYHCGQFVPEGVYVKVSTNDGLGSLVGLRQSPAFGCNPPELPNCGHVSGHH